MFGSHPESKKGPAEKSRVGCKNTVLQLLFGLKVSHTKVTPEGMRKGSFLLGVLGLRGKVLVAGGLQGWLL